MTEKAERVKKDIIDRYCERTKKSKEIYEEALKYMPRGVPRSPAYYPPYPIYMDKANGCYIYDHDNNRYTDYVNAYTAAVHGHAVPEIVSAVQKEVEKGSLLADASWPAAELARILCARIPGMESVRFNNTGTEATLFAIRAARGFTNRDIIIKMDGGYHGSHEWATVNLYPDTQAEWIPEPHLSSRGIPSNILDNMLVAPFNDLEAIEILLGKNQDKVAAVITEPVLGFSGMIPPKEGYLKGLRALADKYNTLLIFDEIITFRFSTGGMQKLCGVEPDLTALGKVIGGGFPVGAFGGKKDIMKQFDPKEEDPIFHGGTFTGNHVSMAAGIACIQKLDGDMIRQIDRLGDILREGINGIFRKAGIRGQATGLGSCLQIHWSDQEISNAKDAMRVLDRARKIQELFQLEMVNRGIHPIFRSMFCTSTAMAESEIEQTLVEIESTIEYLKPVIAEEAPQLIC